MLPSGDEPPQLPEIKPMQRRRLSLLARAVFRVAGQCLSDIPESERAATVCLFANAYGQCANTVKMLETIAHQQPTSPTAFSLSVHNAIAGQFSIAHQLTGPSSTLAPGRDGLGGVMLDAAGWLLDGQHKRVLLCCFEEPVPATLKPYEASPPTPMAAAFLLQSGEAADQPTVSVTRHAAQDQQRIDPFWYQILQFVAYLQTDAQASLTLASNSGTAYSWSRG